MGIVNGPSERLWEILKKNNLSPVIFIEYSVNATIKAIKTSLNKKAGIYCCINLVNGKFYIGSAGITYIHRRYRAHLFDSGNGSKIVCAAVKKYGLENFAFVVLETVENEKDIIISREQYYIDTLKPEYNIAKVAGSVIGTIRTPEQRLKQSLAIKNDPSRYQHLIKVAKNKSEETKALISLSKIGLKPSDDTRLKMSESSAKAIAIQAVSNEGETLQFKSIADCAEFFFNNRIKRGPIRWCIISGKLLFDKYAITKILF